jgi:hypothetical protein
MRSGKERIRRAFSAVEKEQFGNEQFVKLENVFASGIAEGARAIQWRPLDCHPAHPKTWPGPVLRYEDFAEEPFRQV